MGAEPPDGIAETRALIFRVEKWSADDGVSRSRETTPRESLARRERHLPPAGPVDSPCSVTPSFAAPWVSPAQTPRLARGAQMDPASSRPRDAAIARASSLGQEPRVDCRRSWPHRGRKAPLPRSQSPPLGARTLPSQGRPRDPMEGIRQKNPDR